MDEIDFNVDNYDIDELVQLLNFDNNPTYGPFIKLNRVGKNGKIIKVYKLRTMHPYSEYLQKFVCFLYITLLQ